MVVDVQSEPELSLSTPRVAFQGDFVNVGGRSFDVAPDGRFLIIDGGRGTTNTLRIVPNWFDEVTRLVGR